MIILGLDIGTSSIGWSLLDLNSQKIIACGVYIFPEGVGREKGNEIPKNQE